MDGVILFFSFIHDDAPSSSSMPLTDVNVTVRLCFVGVRTTIVDDAPVDDEVLALDCLVACFATNRDDEH